MVFGRGGETITYIFMGKYLGGGWSAEALTLIFGLEVCKPPVTPVLHKSDF